MLRKLGLESHGKRLGGRRWGKKQANQDSASAESKGLEETESPTPPRKRKMADERKEEVAALLEQGKSVKEIAAVTGLKESSVKLYCSILKARTKELPSHEAAPVEAEAPEDDDWDQGPFYHKPEEPFTEAAPVSIAPSKKRRGRPRKNSARTEKGN